MRMEAAAEQSQEGEAGPRLPVLAAGGMKRVDALILERLDSEVSLIPALAGHLVQSGGKRLRPMLTLAAAAMGGYEGRGHILLAAAVELMHSATLLHDDVVDESARRRGKPSARVIWGNRESILVGDFLLGRAFEMMVEAGSPEALVVLSRAAARIASGEVMQLAAARDLETGEAAYLEAIEAKTATLFAAAAETGILLGEKGPLWRESLRAYGRNLGMAFQLVDDVLDYCGGGGLGKPAGNDLREGKVSLPVLLSYRQSGARERHFWKRVIEQSAGPSDFIAARALMERQGSLAASLERAAEFARAAQAALAELEESPWRAALEEIALLSVSRKV